MDNGLLCGVCVHHSIVFSVYILPSEHEFVYLLMCFSVRSYSSLLLKPLAEPEIYMEICVHSFGFRRVQLQFRCLFPPSAKVCMFTKR